MFMCAQDQNLEAKSRLRLISFKVIKAEILTCTFVRAPKLY